MAGTSGDSYGTIIYADNVDFSGNVQQSSQILLDGQLLIGSTAAPHIRTGTISAGTGVTVTNSSGGISIALSGGGVSVQHLTGNSGGLLNPTANNFNIVGSGVVSVAGSGSTLTISSTGTGDVVGPASATDNAAVRFDLTTGKLVQNSVVIIGDSGNIGVIGTTSGSANYISMANGNNTAGSDALIQAQVQGSSGGDAVFQANVLSGQNWYFGLDNSDSDAFALSAGAALGTTNVMRASTAGEINYPLQPAFSAYFASSAANVTGNGTNYFFGDTDVGGAVTMTELYDQGGDFVTGSATGATFTAPVDGKYVFSAACLLQQCGTGSALDFSIVTSNMGFRGNAMNPLAILEGGAIGFNLTIQTNMDAADICRVLVSLNGTGADTADVYGGASDPRSTFSGWQLG